MNAMTRSGSKCGAVDCGGSILGSSELRPAAMQNRAAIGKWLLVVCSDGLGGPDFTGSQTSGSGIGYPGRAYTSGLRTTRRVNFHAAA